MLGRRPAHPHPLPSPPFPYGGPHWTQWQWRVDMGTWTRCRCRRCLSWRLPSRRLRRCLRQCGTLCRCRRRPCRQRRSRPSVVVNRTPSAEPLAFAVVVVEVFLKCDGADLVLLGNIIAFVIVPSTPHPPAKPLLGLQTLAACVHPLPLLSVAIDVAIVVVIVVVVVVSPPPLPPPPNAPPSSSSSSMAGIAALTYCCCVQEAEVKKQLQRRWDNIINRSTGDTDLIIHARSHGTAVLCCTWRVPQTYIYGIHNILKGWEALMWGYGVRITMVSSTEMRVDRIFGAGKATFWDSGFKVTLPWWLLISPRSLIWVGTSTVIINQYQGGLTTRADYNVNGCCQVGGVLIRQ